MTHDEAIRLDQEHIMHTYGRFPLAAQKGSGATVTGADGSEYIDFAAGIGTASLGYADRGWIEAVTNQLGRIQHVSNYFVSPPTADFAQRLCAASGFAKKVFFCNSGAEANEGAIKCARKYGTDRHRIRNTILTFENSFHGRTVTTLAATGQEVFHELFHPLTGGFRYAKFNDMDSVRALTDDTVCAVMIEPVQGEGGVHIASRGFLTELADFCAARDILLIFDEVQTGMGRTGRLFGFSHYGVTPDLVTLAKGIAGGLPMGAFLTGEKTADVLEKGQHGSTFGGNPVCAAAAIEVLGRVGTPEFLRSVAEKGEYLVRKILQMRRERVEEVRHLGLMIGISLQGSHRETAMRCFENRLLVLTAGANTLRLLPPLVISYEEMDEGLERLNASL